MTKKIGITCDLYKVNYFRKGLLADGFKLEYDGPSGIKGTHLFRIEVEAKDFNSTKDLVAKTVKKLEVGVKRSN